MCGGKWPDDNSLFLNIVHTCILANLLDDLSNSAAKYAPISCVLVPHLINYANCVWQLGIPQYISFRPTAAAGMRWKYVLQSTGRNSVSGSSHEYLRVILTLIKLRSAFRAPFSSFPNHANMSLRVNIVFTEASSDMDSNGRSGLGRLFSPSINVTRVKLGSSRSVQKEREGGGGEEVREPGTGSKRCDKQGAIHISHARRMSHHARHCACEWNRTGRGHLQRERA